LKDRRQLGWSPRHALVEPDARRLHRIREMLEHAVPALGCGGRPADRAVDQVGHVDAQVFYSLSVAIPAWLDHR
jgi:hypothetical protein